MSKSIHKIERGYEMIVEFVGVPGSGKTYISQAFCDYINSYNRNLYVFHRYDIEKKIHKDGKVKNVILLFPYIFNIYFLLMIINIVSRRSTMVARINLLKIFLLRVLTYQKIKDMNKHNKKNIYILDEGFLHFSIAFFRQNKELPESSKLKNYMNILDKIISYKDINKIFVFIESDIKKNYRRIEKRESGWPGGTKLLCDEEKMEYLEENYKGYSVIRDNKNLGVRSIIIDNSSQLTDYSCYFDEIIEKLEEK